MGKCKSMIKYRRSRRKRISALFIRIRVSKQTRRKKKYWNKMIVIKIIFLKWMNELKERSISFIALNQINQ